MLITFLFVFEVFYFQSRLLVLIELWMWASYLFIYIIYFQSRLLSVRRTMDVGQWQNSSAAMCELDNLQLRANQVFVFFLPLFVFLLFVCLFIWVNWTIINFVQTRSVFLPLFFSICVNWTIINFVQIRSVFFRLC